MDSGSVKEVTDLNREQGRGGCRAVLRGCQSLGGMILHKPIPDPCFIMQVAPAPRTCRFHANLLKTDANIPGLCGCSALTLRTGQGNSEQQRLRQNKRTYLLAVAFSWAKRKAPTWWPEGMKT